MMRLFFYYSAITSEFSPQGWLVVSLTVSSSDLPQALKPFYQMAKPNEIISLYSGEIELVCGEKRYVGAGSIFIRWFPSISTVFEVKLDDRESWDSSWQDSEKARIVVSKLQLEEDIIITKIEAGGNSVRGILKSRAKIGDGSELKSLVFHLTNFVDPLTDSSISVSGRYGWRKDGLVQEDETWRVRVHALENRQEIFDLLKKEGGYAITHVGKIEKCDKSTFTVDEAESLVEKLFWYFSFLKGLYCSPFLVVGFDETDSKVWELWNTDRIQSDWRSKKNWLPKSSPSLSTLFKNYLIAVREEANFELIGSTIKWYIESQQTKDVSQGILWAQMGLEALSWVRFVDSHISKDGFERLPMADRLRLLLSSSKIPIEIPQQLTHLGEGAKAYNWKDGPQAIAEMRNKIAHPSVSQKDRNMLKKLGFHGHYELEELCRWYLELALLKFFNYSGEYHNRLHSGANVDDQELVPWASDN